ncbi:estradiol 17-beta-dehydrogenase [Massariosphaeria phaeospora]|uniref:Estradiol 17-beta-dehydrogenase n=1 Tax=Massariosphaeria phaeospora TaxID=100035 RepID=A0A7C8IKQ8_9PLEO|nr:estradiol 17-beta-dehydrogenase [Massariosphaeria phaeospora]
MSTTTTAPQPPVWFITAASSGFGKSIALEALSRGHRVIATARNTAKIRELKDAGADTLALDVTSPLADIEAVAKEANERYGYITHLVNAAGSILVGAVEETSPAEDLAHFSTNVFGMLNVSKALIPYLRATSGAKTILNFGSIASWQGGAGYALYNGSKWACSGISEGLRHDVAPFDIAVCVAEPGYFRTGFLNAGAKVVAKREIDAYRGTAAGQVRAVLDQVDSNQPGDVVKGCRVLVDVMTRSGVAEGKEVPVRIALGADSPPSIREKMAATEALLKEWEVITTATNHD